MIKRILLALALLAVCVPALAQTGSPKTKTQLNTEIGTNFPDNTSGAITPAILRQTTLDMVASWQQFGGVSAQTTASYTIQASDYGQLVTVTNASPIAVTLPQAAGAFQTFSFSFKNVGATTATITPITSTINGAASLSVTAGNAFYIVSDGANWQAVSFGGGAGGVTSITNSDGTLTISPTTGAAVGSLNLGHVNAWTGAQTFNGGATANAFTLSGITGSVQCLHVNTSGVVSGTGADCGTGGGGTTPGGSNTQVQYNNAGVFGGIAGVTTNGSNLVLPDTATWSTTGLANTNSYTTVSTPTFSWAPTWNFSSTGNGIAPISFAPTLIPTGATAGNFGATAFQAFLGTSAVNVNNVRAASFVTTVNAGYTGTVATANAISLNVGNSGTNPITTMSGIANNLGNNGIGITSGTVTNILYDTGVNANAPGAGGTINNYAYRATVPSGSGAGTTNNRGIYITGNGGTGGAGATNNFALYSDSTAPSFLQGGLTATSLAISGITGASTQCLQASTTGVVSGTGAACGGSGGTPGGASGQVQWNNAGAFAGLSGLTTGGANVTASTVFTVTGTINTTGTFQVNSNTMTFPAAAATLTQTIASGATALGTPAIASGTCATTVTATATGVLTTDAVTASFNNDYTGTVGYQPLTTGGLTIFVFPTANAVNFHVCNNTLASITPGAVTLNWRVVR